SPKRKTRAPPSSVFASTMPPSSRAALAVFGEADSVFGASGAAASTAPLADPAGAVFRGGFGEFFFVCADAIAVSDAHVRRASATKSIGFLNRLTLECPSGFRLRSR